MTDYTLGDTLDIKFTTRAFATGIPTTLAGSPVISAYPGNSTTQITTGITLSVDFDSVTGLHNIRVVATSGNGYATATDYALVITTGTVGGVSVVGEVVGEFTLGRAAAAVIGANIQTRIPAALTANGNIKASVLEFLTTALTETAGQITAAFKQFFDVASPTGTMKALTLVATATNLTNAPTAGDLTATMKASVNAEALDVLNVDTYAEPGQAAPAATATLAAKINYLFKAWRNRHTQDATTYKLFADDATTVDQKAAVSDDATTFDRGEIAAGP